jgi:hypothetical protein
MSAHVRTDWRALFLVAIASGAGLALCFVDPIAQDPGYHRFADGRAFAGVPNFGNVLSNLPFLILGALGAARLSSATPPGMEPRLRSVYLTFFAGSALVGVGSAYYHWAPGNETLAWDRAPMTVAFMAFCALVIGEHVRAELGRALLVPLLALGLLSVLWWWWSEARGAGDLRLYALVQFLPLLLLPLVVWLYPARLRPVRYFGYVFASYVVAKLFEIYDAPLLELIGVSGHSLKHLAAAAGVLFVALALERRRPVAAAAPAPEGIR